MIPLYIAAGGAVGAVARYALGVWVETWAGARFPWGTFLINVLGSFLIGFALRYLEAVRAHEKLHSTKMKETIGANDPAAKLEALLSTDRAALRTQADGEIKRAEQRVCRAAADPIRGERMR